eukprot:scaffold191185_cov20-Tisochrysis_lutea.AAC.2
MALAADKLLSCLPLYFIKWMAASAVQTCACNVHAGMKTVVVCTQHVAHECVRGSVCYPHTSCSHGHVQGYSGGPA